MFFFSVLRQMNTKTYQPAREKTNMKFKQIQYISCEPTQVMHLIPKKVYFVSSITASSLLWVMFRAHSKFLLPFLSSFINDDSIKMSPRLTRADLFN